MTMPNKNLAKENPWVLKYSIKPLLSKGTLNWYKYCQKIGRRKYLKKSRLKTLKFNKNNPGNLNFRVFKSTTLKSKNVNPELQIKFKRLVESNKSAKGMRIFKDLTPKELYKKMEVLNAKRK